MTNIDALFNSFDGAFAKNTLRAYRSDLNHFADWLHLNQHPPDPLSANAEQWAAYVEQSATELAPATVRRRIDSLNTLYQLAGLSSHANAPCVVLALKRMYRNKGRRQQQASPLTREVLHQLLKACSQDTRGLRDQVLLHLGYETMRRRAELCLFRFDDLITHPNGAHALLLRHSKTDQFGEGRLIGISGVLYELIMQWQTIVGDGYILRGISAKLTVTPRLDPSSINRILQRLQADAALDISPPLTGHSFRVGRALDLLMEGESLEKIMLRGGWKSESSAIRYLRAWTMMTD